MQDRADGDGILWERVIDGVGKVIHQNPAEASIDFRADLRMLPHKREGLVELVPKRPAQARSLCFIP